MLLGGGVCQASTNDRVRLVTQIRWQMMLYCLTTLTHIIAYTITPPLACWRATTRWLKWDVKRLLLHLNTYPNTHTHSHTHKQARDKQMARLGREEALAACQVQLANGKRKSLASLRGFARVVVCAGTNAQVNMLSGNCTGDHGNVWQMHR